MTTARRGLLGHPPRDRLGHAAREKFFVYMLGPCYRGCSRETVDDERSEITRGAAGRAGGRGERGVRPVWACSRFGLIAGPRMLMPDTGRWIATMLRLEAPARARPLVLRLEELSDALERLCSIEFSRPSPARRSPGQLCCRWNSASKKGAFAFRRTSTSSTTTKRSKPSLVATLPRWKRPTLRVRWEIEGGTFFRGTVGDGEFETRVEWVM